MCSKPTNHPQRIPSTSTESSPEDRANLPHPDHPLASASATPIPTPISSTERASPNMEPEAILDRAIRYGSYFLPRGPYPTDAASLLIPHLGISADAESIIKIAKPPSMYSILSSTLLSTLRSTSAIAPRTQSAPRHTPPQHTPTTKSTSFSTNLRRHARNSACRRFTLRGASPRPYWARRRLSRRFRISHVLRTTPTNRRGSPSSLRRCYGSA